MTKIPFVSKEKVEEIAAKYPTPFHLYDEKESGKMLKILKKHFPGIRDIRSISQLRLRLIRF